MLLFIDVKFIKLANMIGRVITSGWKLKSVIQEIFIVKNKILGCFNHQLRSMKFVIQEYKAIKLKS